MGALSPESKGLSAKSAGGRTAYHLAIERCISLFQKQPLQVPVPRAARESIDSSMDSQTAFLPRSSGGTGGTGGRSVCCCPRRQRKSPLRRLCCHEYRGACRGYQPELSLSDNIYAFEIVSSAPFPPSPASRLFDMFPLFAFFPFFPYRRDFTRTAKCRLVKWCEWAPPAVPSRAIFQYGNLAYSM